MYGSLVFVVLLYERENNFEFIVEYFFVFLLFVW